MRCESVSVLICTRNNARRLRRTLEAIERLDDGGCVLREILVVDNGSTDATSEVIGAASSKNRRVRLVYESHPGHNRAYNTGIAEAKGDYVLFTDDDVRPPCDWVVRMYERAVEGSYDALAGGVTMSDRYARVIRTAGLWSIRDWFAVTDGQPSEGPGIVAGANMLIKRSVLEEAGPFVPELGPGAMGFCGDTEYFRRIDKLGYQIGYAYDIGVDHRFALDRVRWSNLRLVAERRGASDGYMKLRIEGETLRPPSYLRWITYDLPRLVTLPLLSAFWPGARARQAHLIRRRAATIQNVNQQRRTHCHTGAPQYPCKDTPNKPGFTEVEAPDLSESPSRFQHR